MASRLTCEWCKTTFVPRRSDARYCSPSCGSAARRQRAHSPSQPVAATSQRRRSSALTRALARAFAGAAKTPTETALTALARVYGREIDRDPDTLAQLGPQLLDVLTKLGITPAAPPHVGDGDGTGGTLVKLRERADRRKHRAAAVPADAP